MHFFELELALYHTYSETVQSALKLSHSALASSLEYGVALFEVFWPSLKSDQKMLCIMQPQ